MASPGVKPIQLITATNPCLCVYLAQVDGALLDAIARPEEASRTLLIRAADRLPLSAARQSALLRRTLAISTGSPSSPAAEALCYRRWAGGQAPRSWLWPFAPAMTVRILIADGLSGAAFLERHIAPLS